MNDDKKQKEPRFSLAESVGSFCFKAWKIGGAGRACGMIPEGAGKDKNEKEINWKYG